MSSDSDSDFWNDLGYDTKSVGVSADIVDEKSENIEKPIDYDNELLSICPNEYFSNRVRCLLDQLRTALKQEYENNLGTELRKQEREFNKKTQKLISKQRNDMLDMKKDYDSLKFLLITKDEEISRLQRLAIDQEVPLSKQRLYKYISKAQLVEENKNNSSDTVELHQEIKAKDLQILGMKELVKMYQEQTEKAKKDLMNCEAELKSTIEQAAIDLKKQCEENAKKCEDLNAIIISINEKYKIFKEEVKKELEISQIIIKQQAEINNSLKKELVSAKQVLITPRLRDKFISKINGQDFSKDFPKDFHKDSSLNDSRLQIHKLRKRDSTLDYLVSTRASPALIPSPDMNLNSSLPLVGLLPEITQRHQS